MKKHFDFWLLSGILLVLTARTGFAAAPDYLDLQDKRINLISSLRNLGPTEPDWILSRANMSPNYATPKTDDSYYLVGNYRPLYLGVNGSVEQYDFIYNSGGVYTISDNPLLNAVNGRWLYDFGFDSVPAYDFSTATVWDYVFHVSDNIYNVAGLRYNWLFIIKGVSGGNLLGWQVYTPSFLQTSSTFDPAQTFDLAQNVEYPAFKVHDFWFGYFNYWPMNSYPNGVAWLRPQSLGAALLADIHGRTTNSAWVEEAVYRPGMQLQPGYTQPRLHTGLQLYFDSAWKCDPVTGQLPRLSATNWNGVGLINTNLAQRTGTLLGLGYYYVPSAFGKAILKSEPLENGFYGEYPVYSLGMLVDKNRDGTLDTNDVTNPSDPHIFWVNNDCDRATYSDDNLWDEIDMQPGSGNMTDADWALTYSQIPAMRDLEDYDRLHIRGLKELCRDLPAGVGYTIRLRWKSITSGDPGIFVFKAVEAGGGQSYLTNLDVAALQILPATYPPTGNQSPSALTVGRVTSTLSPVLFNDNYRETNEFFIYCGTSRGSGELAVSLYNGNNLIGEASVFLDIRDVKEMYERWSVGEGNGSAPATNAVVATDGLPLFASPPNFPSSGTTPYILFVHGWNMATSEKDAFAETAFKRLYWQGYKGNFGSFRWPTTYGFTEEISSALFDGRNFDSGEYSGWRSGEGLRALLVSLNSRFPGHVYMLSHSMGAVPAGEALALQAERVSPSPIVNVYVASQGAVPVECYNTNLAPAYNLLFEYGHPAIPIWSASRDWDSHTAPAYSGWLATNRFACVGRVNFYNPHDYALSQEAWQFNQLLKPDNGITLLDYDYGYRGSFSSFLPRIGKSNTAVATHILPSPARRNLTPPAFRRIPGYFMRSTLIWSYSLDFEYNLSDMYEVLAFAAEARTMPLGRVPDPLVLEGRVDLRTVWGGNDTQPDPTHGSFGRHKWHSAQFRSNNMNQKNYWANLIGRNGFSLFLDR